MRLLAPNHQRANGHGHVSLLAAASITSNRQTVSNRICQECAKHHHAIKPPACPNCKTITQIDGKSSLPPLKESSPPQHERSAPHLQSSHYNFWQQAASTPLHMGQQLAQPAQPLAHSEIKSDCVHLWYAWKCCKAPGSSPHQARGPKIQLILPDCPAK